MKIVILWVLFALLAAFMGLVLLLAIVAPQSACEFGPCIIQAK